MTKNESCIRFENVSLFNSLVQQSLSIQQSAAGLNDANSCLLIEQIEFSKTALTSLTPGRNIVTRFFNHQSDYSGGSEGLRFLVIPQELEDRLGRLKTAGVDAITLKAVKKGLQITGIKMQGNEQVEKHRLLSRLYPGADTEFGSVFRSDSLVGEVKSIEFDFLIDSLLSFGGFSQEKQYETGIVTAGVHFLIKGGFLTATTSNTNKCNQAHIEITIPFSSTKETEFCVEGFQLKALKGFSGSSIVFLSETTEPIEGNDWVTFESQNGVVTLRKVSVKSLERLKGLNLFDPMSDKAPPSAIRVVDLNDLDSCVASQQPSGVSNSLLISELKPHLQIQDAQDITANEFSVVDINPDCIFQDWEGILANKYALVLACDALRKCVTFAEIQNHSIAFVQKAIEKKSGRKSSLISLSLFSPSEQVNVRFFCPVNLAKENLDTLDSKD